MEPYAHREIRFAGVREARGWALKTYGIRFGEGPMDWRDFEPAIEMALEVLPEPDPAEGRPGLGLLIAHQGKTGDYLVLGWWSQENELPLEVWVRRELDDWRSAVRGESVCVWDLEVLWEERQAWVATMMSGDPDPKGYLARVPSGFAG